MNRILSIKSSILAQHSVSSQLVDELIGKLSEGDEEIDFIEKNFQDDPIPHLDGSRLQALMTPAVDRSDEQQTMVDYSDGLIAELQAADTVIIGIPMYNFSVPSMLKAWVDHVARAGVTFKYTDTGSVGLLEGKKVYLLVAMGGVHDTVTTDFVRPYMNQIMSFVGLNDVELISADGLNMGEQRREQGLQTARQQINQVAALTTESVILEEKAA